MAGRTWHQAARISLGAVIIPGTVCPGGKAVLEMAFTLEERHRGERLNELRSLPSDSFNGDRQVAALLEVGYSR